MLHRTSTSPTPPTRASRTIESSCFTGQPDAAKQFVALERDDPGYRYFFGELLLCFAVTHEDERHECCFVEYVWPADVFTREKDGLPLQTKYVHTAKGMYVVRPVEQVLFSPPLVTPPAFFEPVGHART